jgi:hypothetical protein
MNPRAIQRAIVRMLYDPGFVAAIHGARPVAGLDEAERALLRRVDPRALATDRFRRARAVEALVQEFPASAAALGLPAVEGFLGSREFITCLGERGSMGLAFATWLKDQAAGAGRIEAAMARLRRPGPPTGAGLLCAPHIAPVIAPAGTLAWYEATVADLGPAPLQRLAGRPPATDLPRRSPIRARERGDEFLLIEATADGGMALGTASEALVRLLRFAATARPRAALAREAVARGAAAHEADEVLADLLREGLLVQV